MYNLPKRKKTITVEPEDYEGVRLTFATIGPERVFELMEAVGLKMEEIMGEEIKFDFDLSVAGPMLALGREKIVSAEGLTIGGEPFDASDPDHVNSLTTGMIMAGVNELLSYPFLSNDAGKGSRVPAEPSRKDSTPSERSLTANAGSL